MQNKKSKLMLMIAALGLIGLMAGGASAARVQAPWKLSSATFTFVAGGLSATYWVDQSLVFIDTTLAANNNVVANTFFNSEQQCWNGALTTGPSRSGLFLQQSRTTACTAAQGGTGAGHLWMTIP